MGITYASSISSLRTQTDLSETTRKLSKTYERLSSGLRINSASDDAAGLALAESLRTDTQLASVAIRNANDGISITSIADAGLGEIASILSRMSELAEQSGNGVYTNEQRSALSAEFLALGSEIERIAVAVQFNGRTLLSNSSSTTLQVGLDSTLTSRITIQSVLGTLASLGLANGGNSALSFSIIANSTSNSQSAAANAIIAVTAAINSLSSTRGILGAAESRLSSAISYLTVVRENFVAAESRIRDADIAQEVAEMVRLQVLQQAETAVLAQANQQPAVALELLQ